MYLNKFGTGVLLVADQRSAAFEAERA